MRPQFKTLEELRENLAVSLGFGAVPGAIDLQIPILTQFLQQAQQQLWRDVRWQHLLRTHIEPLGVAQRVLDVPDDFSVGKVEQVYRRQGGGWQKLTQGFPVFMDGERKGPPEFYEVSARFDGRHAQIEFWPLPQELVAMRIDYYAVPQRFTHNNDRASVPDDLLLALALVTGKGHYRQPDVQLYADRFNNMLRQAKADNFGSDGEVRQTYADLYSVPVGAHQIVR